MCCLELTETDLESSASTTNVALEAVLRRKRKLEEAKLQERKKKLEKKKLEETKTTE